MVKDFAFNPSLARFSEKMTVANPNRRDALAKAIDIAKPKKPILPFSNPAAKTLRVEELQQSLRTLRKKPFTKILRKTRQSLEPEWKRTLLSPNSSEEELVKQQKTTFMKIKSHERNDFKSSSIESLRRILHLSKEEDVDKQVSLEIFSQRLRLEERQKLIELSQEAGMATDPYVLKIMFKYKKEAREED